MTNIIVLGRSCELNLHRHAPAVVSLNNQVNLMLSPGRTQVGDRCLRRLGKNTHGQRREALKQRPEKTPGMWSGELST